MAISPISFGSSYGMYTPGTMGLGNVDNDSAQLKGIGQDDKEKQGGKSSPEDCETCKNRKYVDGSDEMVSFKSPTTISPQRAGAAVAAHESEHVSNAYKDAAQNNGQVLRASVSIKTAICPECGRSYVSGGTTSTAIKYYNEDNPYQKDLKATDGDKYRGMNVNFAV